MASKTVIRLIWQFWIAAISFVIDCKELKLAQTAQIDQLFQLLTLMFIYGEVCYRVQYLAC